MKTMIFCLVIVLMLVMTGCSHAINLLTTSWAPVAAFSATPSSGSAPLTVNFTDQSGGNPTSWSWTFGDGGTSTEQNPSHQYANTGSYDVTLTVSNAFGSDHETKTGYIVRVAEPSGWPATWTGLSTDPDDGGGEDHRDVTDMSGDGYALYYAADSQYLYLRMETVDPPGWPSTAPQGEARYKWWFDTNGTAAYVSGTTVYDAEFLLILEDRTDINDFDGSRDQLGELTLMDDLANIGFKKRWNLGNSGAYITGTPDNGSPSSHWVRECGNGTAGTGGPQGVMGVDIGYQIDKAGAGGNFVDMYISWAALGNPSSLCLIWATDIQDPNLDQAPNLDRPEGTCCLSACIAPHADFHASDASPCVNETITLTDDSTGSPTSWDWTFGDGGTSTDQNPSHQYANAGTYNVTLTVSNGCGSDDETKTSYITVSQAPVAAFGATPTSGCAPLTANFTDQSTGSPTSWSWTFGDGGTSTDQNPSHQYANIGSYDVTLTVTNACGSDDETKTNYITVSQAPVAAFSATPTSGCAPLTVHFTDQSTGNSTSWNWTFGDGGTSTLQNPSHQYANAGSYNVTLTVSNACGSDDETKTNYITVSQAPVAAFSATPTSGCAPLTVNFADQSTGNPTSWSWTFGNGGTSTAPNPTHSYASAGTYTVSLTVSNACGSDTETKTDYITVYARPTATALSNSPICQGSTIALSGGPVGMTSYNWTGPNGFSSSSQNPTIPNATTLNAGIYYLTVTDGGCTSDPASTVVVVNNRPTANAGADREIPEGSSVVIGGGPTASNGTPPYTYSWTPTTSLNDAGIANPTASPAVTTTYTVIVTDSKGCTDADDVTVTLAHGCCICGFVYRAGTTEALGGWEVILEKKTSPWHEVQRTTTDADGKYCFCGLENGEYRVSEVVKPGWDQVSPVPNEHVVTLPEGASDPEYGPFLNFENEHPASPPTVGWETYPINKVRVLLPWIALCAAIMVGVSLLVLRRRRAQT